MNALLDLFNQRKYAEVVGRWNRVEPVADGNKDACIIIAFSLYSLGEFSDCASLCDELLPYFESNAEFYALYGSVLRKIGRVKDSEQVYKKGLSIFPDDSALGNNYANLLIDIGMLGRAKAILENLKINNPDNIDDIVANLKRIELLSETPSQNEELPVKVLTAAFSEDQKTNNVKVKKQKRAGHTTEEISKQTHEDMIEVNEMIKLARLLVNTNPKQTIIDCTLIHSRLSTPSAQLYELAGDAYINLEKFANAELCYLKAFSLSKGTLASLTNMATLALMRGDRSLAIDYLSRAMALDADGLQEENHNQLKQRITSQKANDVSPFSIECLVKASKDLRKVS